ncbi:MAG: hypothetical protein AAGU01_00140 [Clostridiaceae bacterium]
MKLINTRVYDIKGFILVEVMLAVVIFTILVFIVIPSFVGYQVKSRITVCNNNRLQLERDYKLYLTSESLDYSEINFELSFKEYNQDICPCDGEITYQFRSVECSVHNETVDDE